ncbi:MAG TPA: hypothetical protein VMT28_12770 [Terriglobales bacterium]|jgi:hypothetical protein|nr:hypothetical protein [Terriglobales bacterium]
MRKRSLRWLWCGWLLLGGTMLLADEVSTPAAPRTIPEGTTFLIRLNDKLDTTRLQQGKHFSAKLAEDLVAPDGSTIPRGKKIKGHVSSVEQGFHARMLLSFDEIDTGHGKMPLIATVTGVPGEHAAKQPDAEGEIERKGMSKRREIEVAAVGAGLGAAGGAAAGGGKGAAIGAGIGAGAGALAGILTDRNLTLQKGTVLELRLDHPLQVPSR